MSKKDIVKEIQKKSLGASLVDIDQAKGIVDIAIASFNNIDSCGDIIRKGAFTKTFNEGFNRIKHVVDHGWETSDIIGLPLKLWETAQYAIAQSQLNMNSEKGKDIFELYKFFAEHQRSLEHSIAYRIIKTQDNQDISGYDITELSMREYTTCGWGANAETPLISLKSEKIEEAIPILKWLKNDSIIDEEQAKEDMMQTIDLIKQKSNISDNFGLMLEAIQDTMRKPLMVEPNIKTDTHSEIKPAEAGVIELRNILSQI